MFETNVDATYAWLGLALVSVATAGVAATLPTSPPPDASGVAHTIDSVADSPHPSRAEHGLAASQIRLTGRSVSLRNDGGIGTASLHGPKITPVSAGRAERLRTDGALGLRRVLDGVPPSVAFDDAAGFSAAVARARDADAEWRPAPKRLTVRQVHYGGVHVTLVG